MGELSPLGTWLGRLRGLCAKEEMPSSRWTQSQASVWLTELRSSECQLPSPISDALTSLYTKVLCVALQFT